MSSLELLAQNLLSPMVLAFVLGIIAVALRSDLRLPPAFGTCLSIYLLLAIGLKGGAALRHAELRAVVGPLLATLVLAAVVPLLAFALLRLRGRFSTVDAAALAAHYGSVSAVTYAAASVFVQTVAAPAEAFMPALVAVLEVPAIAIALLLARRGASPGARAAAVDGRAVREVLTGRSILLLVGGMLMGLSSTEANLGRTSALFVDLFPGVLVLFLLDLGMTAGQRLRDLRQGGLALAVFAVGFPLVSGALGVLAGTWSGLSLGGATVLGVMSASASYIAAPAAVRVALPEANPAYYLTAAIAITFPFNLVVGIPLLHAVATWIR